MSNKSKITFEDSTIYFYGAVGDEISDFEFTNVLNDLIGRYDAVTIRVNSPGGDVFVGYAIYNAIKRHADRISIYIDGIAASMASLICMAGKKCSIAQNGIFFIHNPRSTVFGSAESSDLKNKAKLLDQIKVEAIRAYKEKTGLDESKISVMMDNETSLSADEALELGFVDEIVDKVLKTNEKTPEMSSAMDTYYFFSEKSIGMSPTVLQLLELPEESENEDVEEKVKDLLEANKNLSVELELMRKQRVEAVLSDAKTKNKLTDEQINTYRKLIESNYNDAMKFISSLQGDENIMISTFLKDQPYKANVSSQDRSSWTLNDYRKNDPEALERDPQLLQRLIREME